MRYEQFLLQEGRSNPISQEKAFETIKTKCDQAWQAYQNRKQMFRGISQGMEYLFIDPKSGKPRKSANTSNYYTLLIDNSPLWKKYPKRSESIICTNSYMYASNYGDVYEIFPYDNSKIGISPERDFWFSFENSLGHGNSMNYFNFWIDKWTAYYDIIMKDKNINEFKKTLEKLENELKGDTRHMGVMDKMVNRWRIKKESLIDNFNKLLDPKPNHFEVVTNMNDIPTKDNHNGQELWTDGKSVMIKSALGAAGGLNPHLKDYMES